jgi:hypothetical protein
MIRLFSGGRRRSVTIGAALCAMSAAVPAVWGEGVTPSEVSLLDGVAWLSNDASGDVVRVNGETGRVDARVGLGSAAGELGVEQRGNTVLVRVGAEVRSIDVAELDWGSSTEVSGRVVVGERVAYMFDLAGTVRALDPATLETLGEVSLDATPRSVTVAGNRLVAALNDGTVKLIDEGEIVEDLDVGSSGDAVHVTSVGNQVTILNESRGELRRLNPETGRARRKVDVDLPSGDLVVPEELPSGRLWVVAPHTGQLVGVDARSGEGERIEVTAPRHELTPPVSMDGHVYLVDKTAREIIAADAKPLEVVRREQLAVEDASKVQLMAEGGKVFVNDPNSSVAVVIDGDDYRPVNKYVEDGVSEPSDIPPPPGASQGDATADQGPTPGTPAPIPGLPAPPPLQPPPAPRQVQAVAGNERATVSWAHGAGGGFPSAYHVRGDGGRTIDVPGNQLSVEVDGLRNGQTYVFEVWSSNDVGDSERVRSNEVEPNDEVPGTPGGVQAESGDASAQVSWTAADGRGNDIANYIVTAAPGGQTQEVAGNQTQVDFANLTNGESYTFTVTAVNDRSNQSAPSGPSNPVTPYGPPGQVRLTVGSPEDGRARLTWTEAPNDSDTPVTYQISVTPAPGSGGTTSTQATQHTITGLRNGTQYRVTITPTNDRGSGPSTSANVIPGKPPAVSGVTAQRTADRDFRVNYTVDNGGRSVTSCTVSVSGGSSTNCNASSGSVTVNVPQFSTDYTFTVAVRTELGNDSANASGTSNGKPLTVDASATRWDGATCSWPGHENQRPLLSAANTCQGFIGWVPDNTTVRAVCWTTGEQYQDDQMVQSNRFVRATYSGTTGYMGVLYFDGFGNQDNLVSGLRRC